MIYKKLTSLCAMLVLLTGFASVQAQFQGHIEMKAYSYEKGKMDQSTLNLYATGDRILIKGEENFRLNRSVSAEGLLIRNDMQDFVVMVGEKQALQVTKKELEDLMDMFMNWGSEKNIRPEEEPNYRYSDRTRTINGYECAELIVENDESDGAYLSVWLTPNIDINWGMLAEPWNGLPADIEREFNQMGQDVIFKGKNFPMLIEVTDKNGVVKPVMEVSEIKESNMAKAMVQIPADVSLVSAKEYLFKMMMQN